MRSTILLLTFFFIVGACLSQIFDMKKTYTGGHYGFKHVENSGFNNFIVQFNNFYNDDQSEKFHQIDGNEFGQTFTTSGFRLIWGKNDMKWTASTDYAFGMGKDKNEAHFANGIEQHMLIRLSSNQINTTFGIALNENKVWLEGMIVNNLSKVIIEYSTVYPNGDESFGSEYKLNGFYTSSIKTMEFGVQASYKYKKYVFYSRAMLPMFIMGPDVRERTFVDARSNQKDPKDFPSDYESYLSDPSGHIERNEQLKSSDFKGYSFGFGMLYLIGKDK